MKPVNVGLLGLGTVGGGTFNVLKRNAEEITRRAGRGICITHAAAREYDAGSLPGVGDIAVSDDAFSVVENPEVDIVVELIGGYEPARELVLKAPDRAALFVDWLRELLFIQVSEQLLFNTAEIAELDETGLVARVAFRHPLGDAEVVRELKGVTYHDLELVRRGDGWFARIVFDL